MFVLAIYKTSHARYYDNVDWRHVQYPDKQCGYYWYPDSVTVYLADFAMEKVGAAIRATTAGRIPLNIFSTIGYCLNC